MHHRSGSGGERDCLRNLASGSDWTSELQPAMYNHEDNGMEAKSRPKGPEAAASQRPHQALQQLPLQCILVAHCAALPARPIGSWSVPGKGRRSRAWGFPPVSREGGWRNNCVPPPPLPAQIPFPRVVEDKSEQRPGAGSPWWAGRGWFVPAHCESFPLSSDQPRAKQGCREWGDPRGSSAPAGRGKGGEDISWHGTYPGWVSKSQACPSRTGSVSGLWLWRGSSHPLGWHLGPTGLLLFTPNLLAKPTLSIYNSMH